MQNFVTIATPHLGIVRPAVSNFNAAYNYFATFIVSHAGTRRPAVAPRTPRPT